MEIDVAEIIERTIQGEGMYIGEVVSVLRLPGCNLKCKWCDTDFLTTEKVELDDLKELLPMKHVIITGGEPTMNSELFQFILRELTNICFKKIITVETNGMFLDENWLNWFPSVTWAISPKLKSSGNIICYEQFIDRWRFFAKEGAQKVFFKFVITENIESDMFEAMTLISQIECKVNLYFQPVNNDLNILKKIVEIGPNNARYLLQLHKLIGVR